MFVPRHPVVENQFCKYGTQTGSGSAGIGGVICYAGTVVYLNPAASDEESEVYKMAHGVTEIPFGFAMQKVKTGYHQVHPAGFSMPGDLGSSDVIAQPTYNASGAITGTKSAPMGVAHMGIYDTVHYTCEMTASVIGAGDNMKPGDILRAAADEGKVTNNVTDASDGTTDDATGAYVTGVTTQVATVVKGASVAKCQANIDNTVLYPVRVKLVV